MSDEYTQEKYILDKRAFYRETLDALYIPAYDDLCKRLEKHPRGTYWAPYCGLRSNALQHELFNKGRDSRGFKIPGQEHLIVTNARPGFSPHNWGCATDWAEFRPEFKGKSIWDKADWGVFAQCVRQDMRLKWGGDFMVWSIAQKQMVPMRDNPHAELKLRVKWSEVGEFYMAHGEAAAFEFIKDNAFTNEGE